MNILEAFSYIGIGIQFYGAAAFLSELNESGKLDNILPFHFSYTMYVIVLVLIIGINVLFFPNWLQIAIGTAILFFYLVWKHAKKGSDTK